MRRGGGGGAEISDKFSKRNSGYVPRSSLIFNCTGIFNMPLSRQTDTGIRHAFCPCPRATHTFKTSPLTKEDVKDNTVMTNAQAEAAGQTTTSPQLDFVT